MSGRPCESYHAALERRSAPAMRMRKYLRQVGLSVPKTWEPLQPRETYAIKTIENLKTRYDEGTVTLAIRLLVETSDSNAREVKSSVLTALCIILNRRPDWVECGIALFDIFDQIDVGSFYHIARAIGHEAKDGVRNPASSVLAGMLTLELARRLDGF